MAQPSSPAAAPAPSWGELAPIARTAARGQRRAVAGAALAAILLTALALAALHVGLLSPALASDSGGGSMDVKSKTFVVTLDLRNEGLATEQLSTSIPRWTGVEIHSVVASPRHVAPGATSTLTLSGTVTDCAAVTASGLDPAQPNGPTVTVSAVRPWGHSTATLHAYAAPSVIDEICSPTGDTATN